MENTLRQLAMVLKAGCGAQGDLRLFLPDRSCELIRGISDCLVPPYAQDILYLVDWENLDRELLENGPKNILCYGAPQMDRPPAPPETNILLLSWSVSRKSLEGQAEAEAVHAWHHDQSAAYLLDALYARDLRQLCTMAAEILGNPLIFLDADFRIVTAELLRSEQPDILRIEEKLRPGQPLLKALSSGQNEQGTIQRAADFQPRFLYVPVVHSGVRLAGVLLLEDRVALASQDRELLAQVAKGFRLIYPELFAAGSSRVISEYALVRALSDEDVQGNLPFARFYNFGYSFSRNLYMLVVSVDEASATAEGLRHQLNTVAERLRHIVGDRGLCTPFQGHVVALLNLENGTALHSVAKQVKQFCSQNGFHAGVSPKFSDSRELKRYHRYAMDAVGLGKLVEPNKNVHNFEQMRVYKFISVCSRHFALDDLVPEYLKTLIEYDHANDSNLLETLYYYIYTVKDTKRASELLHIHRNTLLYRLEKIRGIMGIDPDKDGDIFFRLMLSFKFLEFQAIQVGRKLCFRPLHFLVQDQEEQDA